MARKKADYTSRGKSQWRPCQPRVRSKVSKSRQSTSRVIIKYNRCIMDDHSHLNGDKPPEGKFTIRFSQKTLCLPEPAGDRSRVSGRVKFEDG